MNEDLEAAGNGTDRQLGPRGSPMGCLSHNNVEEGWEERELKT